MSTNKEIAELQSSMVQVKIGNKYYPAVRSRRCVICMHPGRMVIEEKLMSGYGYPAIVQTVAGIEHTNNDGSKDIWPEFDTKQLGNHWRDGHCPLDSSMVQALKEQRAIEMGLELEDVTSDVVDHIIVTQAVLSRGYDRLIKGEINVDTKDLLAAGKLMSEYTGSHESGPGQEDWSEFIEVFFEVVRENVDDDQWNQISKGLARHPVMKALTNNETQEAEIVEY